MKFGKIKKIIVLGGSLISVNFLIYLKSQKIKYYFFTSPEQLKDKVFKNQSLKEMLKKKFIKYISTKDINLNKSINKIIDKNTLTISMGVHNLLHPQSSNERAVGLYILYIGSPQVLRGCPRVWALGTH